MYEIQDIDIRDMFVHDAALVTIANEIGWVVYVEHGMYSIASIDDRYVAAFNIAIGPNEPGYGELGIADTRITGRFAECKSDRITISELIEFIREFTK